MAAASLEQSFRIAVVLALRPLPEAVEVVEAEQGPEVAAVQSRSSHLALLDADVPSNSAGYESKSHPTRGLS